MEQTEQIVIKSLPQLIDYFGSTIRLAEILGIRRSNVSLWRRRGGYIPAYQAIQIEIITNGKIRARQLFEDGIVQPNFRAGEWQGRVLDA